MYRVVGESQTITEETIEGVILEGLGHALCRSQHQSLWPDPLRRLLWPADLTEPKLVSLISSGRGGLAIGYGDKKKERVEAARHGRARRPHSREGGKGPPWGGHRDGSGRVEGRKEQGRADKPAAAGGDQGRLWEVQ